MATVLPACVSLEIRSGALGCTSDSCGSASVNGSIALSTAHWEMRCSNQQGCLISPQLRGNNSVLQAESFLKGCGCQGIAISVAGQRDQQYTFYMELAEMF